VSLQPTGGSSLYAHTPCAEFANSAKKAVVNMNRNVYFLRMFPPDTHEELMQKAVLLQAWSDPEGSRKLRFPDFMTMAQDGGKVVSLTHGPPLPPQEMLLVLISVRG